MVTSIKILAILGCITFIGLLIHSIQIAILSAKVKQLSIALAYLIQDVKNSQSNDNKNL